MTGDGTWLKLNCNSVYENGSDRLGQFFGIRESDGKDAILSPLFSTQTIWNFYSFNTLLLPGLLTGPTRFSLNSWHKKKIGEEHTTIITNHFSGF